MKYIKIQNLEHFNNTLTEEEPQDYFIMINSSIRSSKSIFKDGDKYNILNEIDDSEDLLTEEELFDTNITHIGSCLISGNLFKYNY